MSQTKVTFKNIAPEEKLHFKNSQCLLLISVGQESHEGDRFAATIDLINNSFNSCIILLYDSLQRYSMSLNNDKDPSYFHEKATKQGDLWLERNKQYYNKLKILKSISRWDIWINHPEYNSFKGKLLNLINIDSNYKSIFHNTINSYLDRFIKRLSVEELSNFDIERARLYCFEYLLEECVVLCLWPELNCEYEIYPNWHNDAIEETRKKIITPTNPHCLKALRIGFRNTKQIKPQHFELLEA